VADDTDDARAKQALREEPTDKLARAVSRAKIADKLFATRDEVTLGRYRLLDQAGTGGMGVVWSAWDPELGRRVAIKVMKPRLAAQREQIVHEGQALAKLSHPHVVPVHDVGVVDDQVYLVMEWVEGETLRAWASRRRPVREVVRAYREVAMGLAAAHDAGLVHRDFKPDNAMLGGDGRVRVLDFGLAQPDGAGGIAGTPRYMAPEQRTGDEQSPAVDQYALGVALREALPDPPPKWLAAIAARATAEAPAARYPSMHDVVAALGNDPARRTRRRLAIASAVGLAGVAFAVGMKAGDGGGERCTGEVPAGDGAAIATHLGTLGPYGAELAARVAGELGAYGQRWTTAQVAACKAHDRGELTGAIYTTHLACLSRAKVALATAHDVLGATTREQLPAAITAARSLPTVELCSAEVAPPPEAIAARVTENGEVVARARVLALAIDPRAIDAAAAAAQDAEAIGYARQIGRASLVHGIALLLQQQRAEAIAAFDRAARAALAADEPATAIEALARGVYATATSNQPGARPADVVARLDLALAIASGLDGDAAFSRALLYNNLGTLYLGSDRAAARQWFAEAERIRPPATQATFELASIHGNLGMVEEDPARRDALLAREAAELEAALGADHPMTLDARTKAAMFVEHPQRSADLLRAACTPLARLHPHLVERVEQCSYELAWLAQERGDAHEATEVLARITRDVAPEGVLAVGYRALLAGKPADAARAMAAFAERLAKQSGFWLRWRGVDARLVAALAADAIGDRAGAIAHAERAVGVIDGLGDFAASSFVRRRHGRLLALLAQWNAGDVRARTDGALAWARLAGGYDARVAALTGSR
jgi:eukaryotic-like serine/threonine-protein kinase